MLSTGGMEAITNLMEYYEVRVEKEET